MLAISALRSVDMKPSFDYSRPSFRGFAITRRIGVLPVIRDSQLL
jgi:hypothetical protein